jgi:pyruvate,water dikinase
MKKVAGIVTDKGGQTSHAAIVSRELGVACVVGTKTATKTIKEGDIITIDGSTGRVWSGTY